LKHKVRRLYVFGSALTGSFNKESDVGFIVDFELADLSLYADIYFNLKFALDDTLRRWVDLLEERQ